MWLLFQKMKIIVTLINYSCKCSIELTPGSPYCSSHVNMFEWNMHAQCRLITIIDLACSRLRDSGEKAEEKTRAKKRPGAGERQGGGVDYRIRRRCRRRAGRHENSLTTA